MAESQRSKNQKMRPPLSAESRVNQLESLAFDAAEEHLRNGTASSQLITHFLKTASTREQLELIKLEHETELLKAKTEAVKSAQRDAELYTQVMQVFKLYSGAGDDECEDIEDDY